MLKFLQRAARQVSGAMPLRSLGVLCAALVVAILPTSALAAEGDHVIIQFDSPQKIGLIVSLVIGLVSILIGLVVVRSSVLSMSPGDEKMQSVGLAIREGALAYLKKQIATMAIFIVLLFLGLVGLYWKMGSSLALGVGGCFIAGVCASYGSGYAGMLMAVAGNMRTARAAIDDANKSFSVAFSSGAVSGLVTVGVGLTGASAILLAFPATATNLLVGFGFGASLAALFMRVGGGIFTKAADVGADLVGKVEAGIPEDDPRNAAVIADNVGDNVGDCAGMAADVFESYEVTLVASIVLAASTAAIFDSHVWPRLIVFGLDACALGLLASAVASAVTSRAQAKEDPLGALNKGLYLAQGLSLVLTAVLAFVTLGWKDPISTTQLSPVAKYQIDKVQAVKTIANDIADKKKEEPWKVTSDEIFADPRSSTLGLDKKKDGPSVTQMLQVTSDQLPKLPDLKGLYKVTNFSDPNNTTLNYSIRPAPSQFNPAAGQFQTLGSYFASKSPDDQLIAAQVHTIAHIPATPAQGKMPARAENNIDETRWLGPIKKGDFDKEITMAEDQIKKQKVDAKINIVQTVPASLYVSDDGRAAIAVEGAISNPEQLSLGSISPNFYKASATDMNALTAAATPTAAPPMPPQGTIEVAVVSHAVVPWWAFWITLAFGILMSFAIQFLTDHYVSTEKGPTREVANVSTAGAAPMIIQGFAYAATSSVFSVFVIVIALLFPLFVFSPAVYGGYTLSLYGIALVGVGMLTSTAFILAMDTFGPISDNAQGVFEMSGAAETHPEAAHVLAKLDAAGNTTKALTKGYAIATAVVAAVALFHSYLSGAHLEVPGLRLDVPEIFLGLLIGGAAPYLFAAFSINAVGRAAFELINEVRRQFRSDSGIMAGTTKPDYARCVAIVTSAAQKELLAPGILAIALPIAVGFGFSIGKPAADVGGHMFNLTGAQALGGFLAGAIISGQLMAVLLSNSGGIWDNAKKLIEDGLHGGKKSEAHRAAVICDTVGDPFKDTAGPAMNPLIKVMNLVALIIAGIVIQPFGTPVLVAVTAVCVIALVGAFVMANRGSMSEALLQAKDQNAVAPAFSSPSGATSVEPTPVKKKLFVEEDPDQE